MSRPSDPAPFVVVHAFRSRSVAPSHWVVLIWLALATLIAPLPAASASSTEALRLESWGNREGRTMEAAFGGYDRERREVSFVKADGNGNRYPLSELDSASRWRVAAYALAGEEGGSSGVSLATYVLVVCAAVVLGALALLLLLQWIAFWPAARWLTGVPGFSDHFRAFLKLLLVWMVGGGIFVALAFFFLFWGPEGSAALEDPGSDSRISSIQLVGSLVLLAASVLVLRSHYGIGLWRALAIKVLAEFASWLLAVILVVAVTLVIAFGSAGGFETQELRLIEWLLQPPR